MPALADLMVVASGVYIINPNLYSKTPFMGVWPMESLDDIHWDGIWFFGVPYPDLPELPETPPFPDAPEEPGVDVRPIAQTANWLPCGR